MSQSLFGVHFLSHYIGVDVGGTTSTIAIGNSAREVVHVSDQFATRAAEGPRATILAIADEIMAGLQGIGAAPDQMTDIGLSTPGPATRDGVLLHTPNFDPQLWDQIPFRARLEHRIRERSPAASVHYIGDGQAAALGEYSIRSGAVVWDRVSQTDLSGQELDSLFMVIVGTGLGGGEIRGGRAIHGRDGCAGHAGHIFCRPMHFATNTINSCWWGMPSVPLNQPSP